MDTPGRLVLVGSIPVDLVFRVPRLPASGEDVLGSSGEYFVGGGYILLYAAHQAGVRSVYGGRIGSGPQGNRIQALLEGIGCEVIQPKVQDRDSTLVLVLVEPGGERTFVTAHNPELFLDAADLHRIKARRDDVVYVSGYEFTSSDRISAITSWLAAMQCRSVVCDLGPYGAAAGLDALDDLVHHVGWLSMNETESLAFTGARSVEAALALITDHHPELGIMIRIGASGTILKSSETAAIRIPSLHIDSVVDTNGAGDTHCGTFCAGLLRGMGPVDAVWLANCAAALSVKKFGSATAPPISDSSRFVKPPIAQAFQDPWVNADPTETYGNVDGL